MTNFLTCPNQTFCSRQNNGEIKYRNPFNFGWVENKTGKEGNADNQHFRLFPKCFQKPS